MSIYQVRLEKDEDGFIFAQCLDPDVASQGDDREDALRSVKEAIACYLMSFEGQENPEVEVFAVELTAA